MQDTCLIFKSLISDSQKQINGKVQLKYEVEKL